jgi:hypothetical protein
MADMKGLPQLLSRFNAIKPNERLMRDLALSAVREQKIEVPRRTGNLGRSIRIGSVSPKEAQTLATASYALYVHEGTKAHDIRPKNRKALRFPADGGSSTLGGRVRSGGKVRFAKRVRHPGTKANPFMLRGAKKAVEGLGFASYVIERWNRAA